MTEYIRFPTITITTQKKKAPRHLLKSTEQMSKSTKRNSEYQISN